VPDKKMKKKRASGRQPRKKREKSVTGIEDGLDQFFVGGERRIAGFGHALFGPRRTEEYEKMRVTDLARRIRKDLRELVERAYPTCLEEWHHKMLPNYRPEPGMTYETHLLYCANQSVAEEICPGLWERMSSRDKIVSRKALREYQRLLPQFLKHEPRHAAIELALFAKGAASYLEFLVDKRGSLIKEIAAKCDLWPVNLGLKVKVVKGEPVYEMTRLAYARDYLIQLELNSRCDFPSPQSRGSHSPFRLAAEELYAHMLMLKGVFF